jgi:hypothetical protein
MCHAEAVHRVEERGRKKRKRRRDGINNQMRRITEERAMSSDNGIY